jgi:hypothetical protein
LAKFVPTERRIHCPDPRQRVTPSHYPILTNIRNGQRVKFTFVFQNARTAAEFGFERDKKNKIVRIISKDIKKDLKKDDWIYVQICFSKFLP